MASRRKELKAETRIAQGTLDAAHASARAKIAFAGDRRPRRREDPVAGTNTTAIEEQFTGLRGELVALKGLRIDPDHLRATLAAFDPLWEHMTSVERQRVVRLLIVRIDYHGGDGKIGITFSPTGVRTLATETPPDVNS